jgi:hypothetical protein
LKDSAVLRHSKFDRYVKSDRKATKIWINNEMKIKGGKKV